MFAARVIWTLALVPALLQAAPGTDSPSAPQEQIVKVSAKRFEYSPSIIKAKVNVPVVLELTSLDRVHGFAIPDLKLDAEIKPGEVTRVRFVPEKAGTFAFHCNIFCGSGHEEMAGQLIVTN